jgi:hypothetical protein
MCSHGFTYLEMPEHVARAPLELQAAKFNDATERLAAQEILPGTYQSQPLDFSRACLFRAMIDVAERG